MKLGVCGDSFMAAIKYDENDLDNGYNKHFTEILARKLGWEIVTFARGACSNQAIRLQIDEIIKESPDLVIIGTTSPDRMELPIKNFKKTNYLSIFSNDNDDIKYNYINGLYNINHTNWIDKSSEHVNFQKIRPTLISETLNNIFNKVQYPENTFNENEILILMEWFDRFYDHKWKTQQDSWIISNGLRKLQDNNIPFYCINNSLLAEELSFFGDSIINSQSNLNPWNLNTHGYTGNLKTYRFHTTADHQELLADLWYKKIKNLNE